MSRYIVFSFDDARADTYYNAWPILQRYHMTGTINVVTDFVMHSEKYKEFASGKNCAMSPVQLMECQNNGMELACHGSTHKNTVNDILKNIEELRNMGLCVENIGFASPHSSLTGENNTDIMELVKEGTLSYVRTGTQVRREGFVYAALSVVERRTHSKFLYYWLNKNNILSRDPGTFLQSVSVTRYTTVDQILYLLSRIRDGEGVILMFHSVLYKGEKGYDADVWFWDAERFETLCHALKKDNSFVVCSTKKLLTKNTATTK